jgi:c-di-GMP-related signal transduction protein
MAAGRGKLMELLAAQTSRDGRWHDRAFMTVIVSLLDALLEMPMAEVIDQLRLPDDVRIALLTGDGQLARLLRIVEALERPDAAAVSTLLAGGDPCPTSELPALQIEALSWSNGLGKTE